MNIKPQRVRAIGPGTKAMLLGIVAFAIYSTWERPSTPSARFFEADQTGRLVEVDAQKRASTALPPLWKPEPDVLIRHKARLDLRAKQLDDLRQISTQWLSEKSRLQIQIDSFGGVPGQPKPSLASLKTSLTEYSELSRTFNESRTRHWTAALEILDSAQRSELESIRKEGRH